MFVGLFLHLLVCVFVRLGACPLVCLNVVCLFACLFVHVLLVCFMCVVVCLCACLRLYVELFD